MLPEYRKILFASDLEAGGAGALRHAVGLAKRYGAELIVLHVMEPLGPTGQTMLRQVLSDEKLHQLQQNSFAAVRQKLHEQLHAFCDRELPGAAERDVVSEIRIAQGAPAATILAEAQTVVADLLVLGNRRHTTLGAAVLGSVAGKILHASTLPVLLLPIAPTG
jgi:nucleotide-binding universal stress UspA family protein